MGMNGHEGAGRQQSTNDTSGNVDEGRAALRAQAEAHLRALAGERRGCARTSGPRSRRWSQTGAGPWWCSAPAGASRRSTSSPPRCCAPRGAGPTVIISPLLALMRNQIAAAERAGIRAATINSTNIEEWAATYARVQRGEIDVLLLSPERLNNPDFRDQVLPGWPPPAACWWWTRRTASPTGATTSGPDFRRLRTLLPELPAGIPVLATTATANSRVVDDVAEVLGPGPGATTTCWCCAAPRPRVAATSRVLHAARPGATGWPGSPTTSASCPARASSTR